MRFSTNQTLGTVSYVSDGLPIRVIREENSIDATNNSNALQGDSVLKFALDKNQRVVGQLDLLYYAHADKDFKYRLIIPTGGVIAWGLDGSNNADAEVSNAGEQSNNTVTFAETTSSSGVGYLTLKFVIKNGSTAGDVQVEYGANSAVNDASERVYVKTGSFFRYQYF